MSFFLSFIVFVFCFALAYLISFKFKSWVPKEKGFEVGLVATIGILILVFTITFFFPVNKSLFNPVGFGIALGFGHGISRVNKRS